MAETRPTEDAAHQVMEPSDETGEFVEATELLHADAGDVSATRVTLEQSTAKSITSDHVALNKSAVKGITAHTATIDSGFLSVDRDRVIIVAEAVDASQISA